MSSHKWSPQVGDLVTLEAGCGVIACHSSIVANGQTVRVLEIKKKDLLVVGSYKRHLGSEVSLKDIRPATHVEEIAFTMEEMEPAFIQPDVVTETRKRANERWQMRLAQASRGQQRRA